MYYVIFVCFCFCSTFGFLDGFGKCFAEVNKADDVVCLSLGIQRSWLIVVSITLDVSSAHGGCICGGLCNAC